MCMDVKRGTESCNRPHKQTFKNNSKIKKINGELEKFDFLKGLIHVIIPSFFYRKLTLTLSNGNIPRVTGPLSGEFTGYR